VRGVIGELIMMEKNFQYTLTEQNKICLINLSGYLSKKPVDLLEECTKSIESSTWTSP
jgi:hypothetical protein